MAYLARLQLGRQSVQLALLVLLLFQLLLVQLLQRRQLLSWQETLDPQRWCVYTGRCAVMLSNAPCSSCMLGTQQCNSQADFTDTRTHPQHFEGAVPRPKLSLELFNLLHASAARPSDGSDDSALAVALNDGHV